MIKIITFLLFTLMTAMILVGTGIVVYANNPHDVAVVAPTPVPTIQLQTPQPVQTQPPITDGVLSQGNSGLPEVALTFDDGPYPYYTQQILNILQSYKVHATFFVIGENVQSHPDLVQQEHADGYVVGNHTWGHPHLTTLSVNKVHTEISDTSDVIQQTTGERPKFFRPPYGEFNDGIVAQAKQFGLKTTLWNVDTLDWSRPGTNAIINSVLNNVSNGSIILMHDGGGDRSQTVKALPTIITKLLQRGYHFVSLQEMYNHQYQSNTQATSPVTAFIGSPTAPMAMVVSKPEDQSVTL